MQNPYRAFACRSSPCANGFIGLGIRQGDIMPSNVALALTLADTELCSQCLLPQPASLLGGVCFGHGWCRTLTPQVASNNCGVGLHAAS